MLRRLLVVFALALVISFGASKAEAGKTLSGGMCPVVDCVSCFPDPANPNEAGIECNGGNSISADPVETPLPAMPFDGGAPEMMLLMVAFILIVSYRMR
jgi:hypothetical protein